MRDSRGIGLGLGPGMGGGALPFEGILNLYPGANGAYSFRLLNNLYTGPCCRIRRSVDNAEVDISFSGIYVDKTAMTSFTTGGRNAFITTWYDQSGNGNNMTNATASQQPQVVAAGTVILKNGFVAGSYDGSLTRLGRTSLNSGYPFSTFSVAQSPAGQGFAVVSGSFNADNFRWWASVINRNFSSGASFGSTSGTGAWIDIGVQTANTNMQVTGINTSGTNGLVGLNGATATSTSLTGNYFPLSTTDIGIIWRASNPINWAINGFVEEVIHYPQDKTSTRANIEANQKAYYGI